MLGTREVTQQSAKPCPPGPFSPRGHPTRKIIPIQCYLLLCYNSLAISRLQSTDIYRLTISVGQEFGSSWGRWVLAQGLSLDCRQNVGPGCSYAKACLECKYLLPRWHLCTDLGWRPQFLVMGPLHRGHRGAGVTS